LIEKLANGVVASATLWFAMQQTWLPGTIVRLSHILNAGQTWSLKQPRADTRPEAGFTHSETAFNMRAVIPSDDECEVRAKATINARELVDKLHQQAAELEADPRFAQGASLARSAESAAMHVLRLLSETSSDPSPH
jgi:hypothetical protein